jgi:hypothetical protein
MKFTRRLGLPALILSIVAWVPLSLPAADELAGPLAQIRGVQPKGEGHREAIAAWQTVSQLPAARLPDVLAGMDGGSDLSANWIRAAADAIAQRETAAGIKLPIAELEKFLADTNHSPRARQAAFELIVSSDPAAETRLIPSFLNDPSMELRRLAVADALEQAGKSVKDETQKTETVAAYRRALSAARDTDQIDAAAEQLKKLGEQVDLPSHFGFVMRWHLIGPFDNRDKKGFDVAYPPESQIDLTASYPGLVGEVKWTEHTTDDAYGTVDLNKAIGKHMGAIGYAFAEFVSAEDRSVELRMGCINGNKVWLNGELLTANHVYHAGAYIDQYVGVGQLKKGPNQILVKVAQNEQTDDWAQRWQFQLRVCDQYGTAIHSADRPGTSQVSKVAP